jgi:hypothetical protein
VNSRLGQGFFADPAFMTQLDVAFANLYFAAADAAGTPAAAPLAWRPLIEQRAVAGIEPVQFALAGMNAHINHDLPIAMVCTCTALATAPGAGPHFADYQKVDQLLDAAEQSVRQSLESAAELAVDRHLAAIASLVTSWTITSARDLAWKNALLLWAVRDDPIARGLFLDILATSAAWPARCCLWQSETALARQTRAVPSILQAHRTSTWIYVRACKEAGRRPRARPLGSAPASDLSMRWYTRSPGQGPRTRAVCGPTIPSAVRPW